jgi:hypothetical protein
MARAAAAPVILFGVECKLRYLERGLQGKPCIAQRVQHFYSQITLERVADVNAHAAQAHGLQKIEAEV